MANKRKSQAKVNRSYSVPVDPAALSEEWRKLSGEHFESFQRVRKLCDRRIKRFLEIENAIDAEMELLPEERSELLPPAYEVQSFVRCLAQAIEGERQALNMHLQDVTVAVKRVEHFGFLVQRGDGAIEVAAEHVAADDDHNHP